MRVSLTTDSFMQYACNNGYYLIFLILYMYTTGKVSHSMPCVMPDLHIKMHANICFILNKHDNLCTAHVNSIMASHSKLCFIGSNLTLTLPR